MFNERVRRMMTSEKLVTAPLQSSVRDAARLLAEAGGGVVVVTDGDKLAGIFTSRDALLRVTATGRDAERTTLADVMTSAPVTVEPDRPFGYALQLMQRYHVRHLPVVEDGKPIGVVSARNAMDPDMEDFTCEALRREGFNVPERSAN